MKNTSLWMALAVGATLVSTGSRAAAAACNARLSAAEQVVALNAVSNLMGRYAHLGQLRGEDTLQSLFAMKQPDVSWRTPNGPQGPEAMQARFVQPGEAPRNLVPGQFFIHAMLTPVIEIAGDGKTAKGVWDSFGPTIASGQEVGNWLWVKYGVDFIKEDGAWKIWHLQIYAMFNTPYDKSITQSAWERSQPGYASRPGANSAPRPAATPNPAWKGLKDPWIYDGKTPPRGPYIPEPYCTFDPATSYGNP